MIRLSVLQFRAQAAMAAAAVAVFAVILGATGPHLFGMYDSSGIATCQAHGNCLPLATSFVNKLDGFYLVFYFIGIGILLAVPAVIGTFWAAPLLTREFETGTFQASHIRRRFPRRGGVRQDDPDANRHCALTFRTPGLCSSSLGGLTFWPRCWLALPSILCSVSPAPCHRKAEASRTPPPRVSPPSPEWLTVPSVVARVCAWVPLQLRQRRLRPTRRAAWRAWLRTLPSRSQPRRAG